ncbi:MAG: T9SS type A sorting domain-containing protein, partial [Bacteroidetes bacterium]|nr:T9SS type A sorting domain-containing protein [Bacteroidota bacterium]
NDGVCDANDQCPGTDDALIGTACNDGNECTIGETYDSNCNCSGGIFQDSDGDGVCDANDQCPDTNDALISTACDDGDNCTINDVYDGSCNCSGTFQDTDNDGVCDANDQCPGMDDVLIGTACDDGNDCTINDVYNNNNCSCLGTFTDSDGDGVCDANDLCPGFDDNIDANGNSIPDGCEGCSYQVINFNDFESNWGIWNDGGSDCQRSSSDAAYALGTYCVRLRDNSSSSVMTTDNLNLIDYDEITIDFSYYARSMDNSNEDFWLQISTNGGSSYSTVEEWNRNDEFENDQRYYDQVVISGPFTSNTRLRFRCDASGNSDWVYIDEVEISGCTSGAVAKEAEQPVVTEPIINDQDKTVTDGWDYLISPIPAKDIMNIKVISGDSKMSIITIIDINGQIVKQVKNVNQYNYSLDISDIKSGVYLIAIQQDGSSNIITKRFIITN